MSYELIVEKQLIIIKYIIEENILKSLILATASFFIPGSGHLFTGQIKKGLIFLMIMIILIILSIYIIKNKYMWIILLLYCSFVADDCYQTVHNETGLVELLFGEI